MSVADWDTACCETEETLSCIIDACNRSIDWITKIYFRTLKKSIKLFVEKILHDDKYSFFDGFTTLYLNDTEIAQLVKDIEEHINSEIIQIRDKRLPAVNFSGYDLNVSFKYLIDVIIEQRNTVKIARQVEKTVSRLASKTLSGFAPDMVPKRWLSNPAIARNITRALDMDVDSHYPYSKDLIEKHMVGLLNNVEQDIKVKLKYQLAEQLYKWYDQQCAEKDVKTEQLVVNE